MGTITTQILIGNTHTFHGGIMPLHQMFLSENSRAAWILKKISIDNEDSEMPKDITWIPNRPSTILRDGLMMIAYHIIKDKKFRKEADQLFGKDGDKQFLDLCQKYKNEKLIRLFEHCKKIANWPKIVITILEGSHLEDLEMSELSLENISENEICFSKNIVEVERRFSE